MAQKTVLITGASRGIGLAIARHLLQAPRSSRVVVTSRSTESLEKLKAEFPQQVEVVAGDATDPTIAAKAVSIAVEKFGGLDGLVVNHATLGEVKKIADSDISTWKKDYDINFFSAAEFVKAAIPHLRKSKGKVVFTSSGAAVTAYQGWAFYGSSKAAMNHLAMMIAREEPDITAVAVRPGVVNTQMQDDIRGGYLDNMGEDGQRLKDAFVQGKLLKPEQPGNVIANLALNATKDLSGRFLSWNDEELNSYQEEIQN
ncbi:hypothetical protein KEM56_001228 [Ascosphaera pollenicola]|nr:hypothetical protein KEM56_001228 [Ascosphaera pollenicola]